jgi:hypothetical protein
MEQLFTAGNFEIADAFLFAETLIKKSEKLQQQ